MNKNSYEPKAMAQKKRALKKKIHRALFEARNALHSGDEETARKITRQIMAEAAPAALEASKEGSFNWVVEALKPLDDLLLPDDEST
jgi:protein involved in temperature-dependent protein secretion